MTKYDEDALKALFDEVEPPARLEGGWLRPPMIRPARQSGFMRAAAVTIGVLIVGAVAFGVAASEHLPADEDDPNLTITQGPTSPPTPPTTTTSESAPPSSSAGAPSAADSASPPVQGTAGPTQNQPNQTPTPQIAPARGPLAEWPDAANAGVPPGTKLAAHAGDLHITTAGAIIHDIRVDGTVYVEAPDVTLRRVQVASRAGATAGVRQLAPRLRIEDSEVQLELRQESVGLTVQRSYLTSGVTTIGTTGGTNLVDNYVARLSARGALAGVVVRHNVVNSIAIPDDDGPVTDVTIENNQLSTGFGVTISAPFRPGSHHIRVVGNHFRRDGGDPIPSSGWNAGASGNVWTGNVWFGTSDPVSP